MAARDKNSAVVLSVFKGSYSFLMDNHSHKITAATKVQQKQLTKGQPDLNFIGARIRITCSFLGRYQLS